MSIPAKQTRAAASLLGKYGLPRSRARALALAAAESGKSLAETLRLVASLQLAGQGEGPSPVAERVALKARS